MMLNNKAFGALSLLQRMTVAGSTTFRPFGVYPKVIAPRSIAALEEIGRKNYALT